MALDESLLVCKGCGAPREGGAEACRYCEHRHDDDLERIAIPCWGCKTWNELNWEAPTCIKCAVNLWVSCMHCKQDTPCHLKKCIHCEQQP